MDAKPNESTILNEKRLKSEEVGGTRYKPRETYRLGDVSAAGSPRAENRRKRQGTPHASAKMTDSSKIKLPQIK